MNNSTIAAIATPSGRGGIGIIKISGPAAISIIATIFRPRESKGLSATKGAPAACLINSAVFRSHRLVYGYIVDPENRNVLDQVLVSVMKAPATYTREDVVEINAHSGILTLQSILALVLRQGARIAEPGEFTKRAFLNGRIDLTQAEAVIDIINARSEKFLKMANAQVGGLLRKEIENVREVLIGLLTWAEAAIDFPEDIEDAIDEKSTAGHVQCEVVEVLKALGQNYAETHVLRDGLNVAVVGKPNVGKSSLLNRLVQKDRAIVTNVPGTTRDIIEETINLKGIPVIFSDTAGLHDTHDLVETIGIQKTLKHVDGCDLVLFLVEANRALSSDDYCIYDKVKSKPLIIVLNKIDLVSQQDITAVPKSWEINEKVFVSARYGHGIDSLKEKIVFLSSGANSINLVENVAPNLRHKIAIERSLKAAETIVSELLNGTSIDLVTISINEAIAGLDEILGINVKVEILDHIFEQFCVGK